MSRSRSAPLPFAAKSSKARAAALVIAGLLLLPLPVGSQQTGEDPALLRELAERLLSANGPSEDVAIRLFTGTLPPDLDYPVPLPTGGRLLGSLQRRVPFSAFGASSQTSTEVIADAPGTFSAVAEFIDGAMRESGFTVPIQPGTPVSPGGFQTSPQQENRIYCAPAGERAIGVSFSQRAPATVGLRFTTFPNGGLCSPPARGPFPPGFQPLPTLTLPTGVRLLSAYMGGAPYAQTSAAIVESELTPAQVAAATESQLIDAGWILEGSGGDAGFAWARLSIPGDQPRIGLLTVQAGPLPNQRSLTVSATGSFQGP